MRREPRSWATRWDSAIVDINGDFVNVVNAESGSMIEIFRLPKSQFSFLQTINGVCVMNTSAVYPNTIEEGNAD